VILRCTKKLLDVIRPEQLAKPDPEDEDWYANLLVLDRRKYLLLTHAGALFAIFEPDVRASDLRATKNLVVKPIERELLAESLPAGIFGDLRFDSDELLIAKTADRSVLGCMNDTAFLCDVAVADAGSLALTDVASLNHRLRRNINSARNYRVRWAAGSVFTGRSGRLSPTGFPSGCVFCFAVDVGFTSRPLSIRT
jgi:hypothetical protein